MKRLNLEFEPLPPFSLGFTVWCLRRRPDNIVDRWEAPRYQRVLVIDTIPMEISLTQKGPPEEPKLLLAAQADRFPPEAPSAVTTAVQRLLGINTDLKQFYQLAETDERLHALVKRFYGLKPPRFPSLYEALINGIACQQFTLTSGIRLLNKLAVAYGPSFPQPKGSRYAFPRPEDLAQAKPETLRAFGFSRQKAQALIELSERVASGRLDLKFLESLGDEAVSKKLMELKGVGRWTTEYTLLRGLGRLHVFPADDVGGQNNLAQWLNLARPLDYDGVRQALTHWNPYAGFIFFHLLLYRLAEKGYLHENTTA